MSDEEPDDTSEDLAPTQLSSFMRAVLADGCLTGDTFKVSLPAGEHAFPLTPLGPFRYAVISGVVLEYKDGKWLDRDGKEATVTLMTQERAAHRP